MLFNKSLRTTSLIPMVCLSLLSRDSCLISIMDTSIGELISQWVSQFLIPIQRFKFIQCSQIIMLFIGKISLQSHQTIALFQSVRYIGNYCLFVCVLNYFYFFLKHRFNFPKNNITNYLYIIDKNPQFSVKIAENFGETSLWVVLEWHSNQPNYEVFYLSGS